MMMMTGAMRLREVATKFRVAPKTILAWVRAGTFPKPLPCSTRVYLWSPEAVAKDRRTNYCRA